MLKSMTPTVLGQESTARLNLWPFVVLYFYLRPFKDNNGGFPLDHSTQILRISNVSYAHLIKSKASGHTIILQQDVDTYLKPS